MNLSIMEEDLQVGSCYESLLTFNLMKGSPACLLLREYGDDDDAFQIPATPAQTLQTVRAQ